MRAEQRLAKRESALGKILGRGRQTRPSALQLGQHIVPRRRRARRAIRAMSSGPIGSGVKSGWSPAVFGQRSVHLGGAYAELARQHQEEDIGIGQVRCGLSAGRQQRIVEIAGQVIQRLRPAVP